VNLGLPLTSTIPGAPGTILSVLAHTEQPLTGTMIAALSDGRVSQTGVSFAMRNLVASGIVLAVPAGSAKLYSLNRDHLACHAIVELASLRDALFERIREQVDSWTVAPVAVAVFGSAARGAGGSDSDLDLLVVRPTDVDADDATWAQQSAQLTSDIHLWSGNGCDLLEYTLEELEGLVRNQAPLVGELSRDLLDLYGPSLRPLLRGEQTRG